MILITLVYLVIVRLQFLYERNRERKVYETWSAIIKAWLKDEKVTIPVVPFRDAPYFLELWLERRIYCNKQDAEKLDLLAAEVELDVAIERILRPPFFGILPRKIWLMDLALLASQWIYSEGILRQVHLLSESSNQYIAVKACSCLAILKASGYEKAVIRTLFRFPRKTSFYSTHLSRVGGAEIFKILAPFLDKLPDYTVLNFISLADNSKDKTLLPFLEMRLKKSSNANESGALLRVIGNLGNKDQRELVLPFIKSENVFLKARALEALGNLGRVEDIGIILRYLSDPQWWVRYRAARAILALSNNDSGIMEMAKSKLSSQLALEILNHAEAEQEWCLT
jgi:hypothetical protein